MNVPSGWDRPYHLKAEGEFDGVYVRVSGTTRKADGNGARPADREEDP